MTTPTVAISGARGFVGARLARELSSQGVRVVALSRGSHTARPGERVEWRACDLFSYEDALAALEGVDVAFYLVHAMSPAGRLTRGRFDDIDLICADHFARAAKARGVHQIIYLGGLVPESRALSRHLESRREIEHVLAAEGVPVTVLRAGMIVGAQGSSFQMLFRLVRRLRVMLCPRWMRIRTQPIDIEDVVRLLAFCLSRPEALGRVFDIGGPDVMTYEDMVRATSLALGLRTRMLPFAYFTTRLSCLWVSLVTGAPRALVRPLVDSLNHETVARERHLQELAGISGRSFAESVQGALSTHAEKPRAFLGAKHEIPRVARSVERHPLPLGWDAERVAREYMTWLVHFLPFLRAERHDENRVSIHLGPLPWPLLVFAYEPRASSSERAVFRVISGALAHPIAGNGRLEFVRVPGKPEVLSVVHDFRPRLPWWLYKLTQLQIHALVMWAFGRHLARIAATTGSRLSVSG
jgi:uncharacterized protein YbjT (DUF2867 family)